MGTKSKIAKFTKFEHQVDRSDEKRVCGNKMQRERMDEESSVGEEYPYSFYCDRRHLKTTAKEINVNSTDWRIKEKIKTVSVSLVLCLNIGVDPPDLIKTKPSAKMECWIDPFVLPGQRALEAIGRNLQSQYEAWQPRARYRLSLDPSIEETKKLCCSLRRNAKDERILFHYNGHGKLKYCLNYSIGPKYHDPLTNRSS